MLSLAEVNVGRVRLLVDGEPLVADHPEWSRDDVAATVADVQPGADVPALVVAGGRVAQLSGPDPSAPLPGPVGNGQVDAESAASTVDGQAPRGRGAHAAGPHAAGRREQRRQPGWRRSC